jgi:outer membrane lipoprotein carrier protein
MGARAFCLLAVAMLPGRCCIAQSAQASNMPSSPAAAAVARKVDAHYNHLRSLRVQFTETYRGMGMERTETGTLSLAKPGRMLWSYSKPAGKLFLLGGKYAYSYTPGDAQAERYRAKQLDDFRSPLRFLLGHTQLQKELGSLTMTADGAAYRLQGVPLGMEQRVSQVTLTVNSQGEITSMQWRENNGATTEFQLRGEQDNPALPAGTFTFQAPPGVVVVDGLAPI